MDTGVGGQIGQNVMRSVMMGKEGEPGCAIILNQDTAGNIALETATKKKCAQLIGATLVSGGFREKSGNP